jgi:pimeloyl-ACP methyl ester carboxylesterase
MMAAVTQAMELAGVQPGQPVLLNGHSQGGVAAAALAADPTFMKRFKVTHVVSAGSPIARFNVPDSVKVLSLENVQDLVPRTEALDNPDRPNWTTLTRDVGPEMAKYSAKQRQAGEDLDPIAPHSGGDYVRTAKLADESKDPSVVEFRRGVAGFLEGNATAEDFHIQRTSAR